MSAKYKIDNEQLNKWAKNTLIFLAPVLIIFLTAVKGGADIKDALYLVYLWGLNVVIDLLRKFSSGK